MTKTLFTWKFRIDEQVIADVHISEISNGKRIIIGAIYSACQSRIAVREDCSCKKPVAPIVSLSDPFCTIPNIGRVTTRTLFQVQLRCLGNCSQRNNRSGERRSK